MSLTRTLTHDLTHDRRSTLANIRLGMLLAFVAGATNAGGFLAVGQYTSHMTGMVSSAADHLVRGDVGLAIGAVVAVAMFLFGAMTCAILVNWSRRRNLHSRFAVPLLLEAFLLLVFGVMGASVHVSVLALPATVALLCFIMGLQNAVITKISNAVIRTTHLTGLVTDLGIELGKMVYVNRTPGEDHVHADHAKLRVHAMLIGCFAIGAGFGAIGFKAVGYSITIALSLALVTVSLRPVFDDVRVWRRIWSRRGSKGTRAE